MEPDTTLNNSIHEPILDILNAHRNNTSIAHLNTRSVCSNFDEFSYMLSTNAFDVMSISETWLKDDSNLLQYVTIPGYRFEYKNRDTRRGGGVAFYLKDHLQYKVRNDITRLDDQIEHLWLEIQGKNKTILILLVHYINQAQ